MTETTTEAKQRQQDRIRILKNRLLQSLDYEVGAHLDDVLIKQAKTLDYIFKQLITDSSEQEQAGKMTYFDMALRIQNQFHRTAKTLMTLEEQQNMRRHGKKYDPFAPPRMRDY